VEPEGPDQLEAAETATAEAADDSLLPIFMRSEDAKRNVKTAVWKELAPSGVKPHRSMPQVSLVTRGVGAKRNPASHTKHFEQAPPQPPPQYNAEHGLVDHPDEADDDVGAPSIPVPVSPSVQAAVPSVAPLVEVAPAPQPELPPAPQYPPPGALEFAERSAAAVSAMRLTSERLAEQARSDALELALLVSRRILEAELSTNVERFFGVIRSVIRRAGESRRIVVRLNPEDANRVEAAGGGRALSAMAVAQIEISPDAELALGDCMVDADFGMVDGRLTTRLDEMRRLLQEAMAGEDP
jgi:flagellar assembly protein FliH